MSGNILEQEPSLFLVLVTPCVSYPIHCRHRNQQHQVLVDQMSTEALVMQECDTCVIHLIKKKICKELAKLYTTVLALLADQFEFLSLFL